jgi:tight adherence protein B
MELMALALTGGCSVGAAARTAAGTLPDPLAGQLRSVAEALLRGADTDDVWPAAGTHWSPARRCLDLAEVAGVAPAEALSRAAQDLRRDAVVDVEVAAARLGVRLVLPLGLAYLPAFVLTTIVPLVIALTADLSW